MTNGTAWNGSLGFAAAPLIAQADLHVKDPSADSMILFGLWMVIAGFGLVATQRRLRAEKRDS